MTVRDSISNVVRSIPGSEKLPRPILWALDRAPNTTKEPPIKEKKDQIPSHNYNLTPSQTLRHRMAARRGHVALELMADGCTKESKEELLPFSETSSLRLFEENTLQDTESDYMDNQIVDDFLFEQNEKFNTLIHRNLKEVMTQQQQFEGKNRWSTLVLDLVLSKDISGASESANLLVNKLSTAAVSFFPLIAQNHTPQAFVEEYEAHIAHEQIKRLLEPYLLEEREYIYKELNQEFGTQSHPQLLSREHLLGPNATYLDKIEALFILSIRLSFAGLKHSIPLMQLAANKFKNDQIIVFNSSNFNRLLSFIISILEKLEHKVQSSDQDSSQIANEDINNAQKSLEMDLWSNSMSKLVAGLDIERNNLERSLKDGGDKTAGSEKVHGSFGEILNAAEIFASEMV